VQGPFLTFFPQFCREPLNDAAWHDGFTDWDLIKPLPQGTRERFTPAAGHYDLANHDDIRRQFESILRSEWPGIALYHYFFDGRFVLDAVERFILGGGTPVPKFFTIWANEPWSKRWIGKPHDMIIRQNHSREPAVIEAHTDHLCRLFGHPSYSKIDGRPVFVFYAPYEIPDAQGFFDTYRRAFRARGFDPLMGFCVPYLAPWAAASQLDFCVEFQPRLFFNAMRAKTQANAARAGLAMKRFAPGLYEGILSVRDRMYRRRTRPRFSFEYADYLELLAEDRFGKQLEQAYGIPAIRGLFYSWNNYPRYRGSALVVKHRKDDFAKFRAAEARLRATQPWFLVNSWNEWSEGAALEPGVIPTASFDVDVG
jgi:hypothetical protein